MDEAVESDLPGKLEKTVRLFLAQDTALIWSVDDIAYIRERYRIVGNFIGCLPRAPYQNRCLGLPLQLMPEEARLLLDEGCARLCQTKIPDSSVCEERAKVMAEHQENNYLEQMKLAREERKREILLHQDRIREGKPTAKRRKLARQNEEGKSPKMEEEEEEDDKFDVDSIQIPPLPRENALIQLHIESPWADDETQGPPRWNFPTTEKERQRYAVFRHFWQNGFWITSGGKFGGDFLLYKGDPSGCHALYIVKVFGHTHTVCGREMVCWGRLANSVKKTFVMCSVEPNSSKVTVLSLKWAGF